MPDIISLYACTWQPEESYGRIARELADHLEQQGVVVNRIGEDSPQQTPIRLALGGIALGYPTLIQHYGKLLTVGPVVWLTMFESDRLPFMWADILNTVQQVIVPSRFQVEVFQSSGVETPLSVAPLGVSQTFQYVERQRAADQPYTFLTIGDRGQRRAWDKAGFAFMRAFGDDPRYRLILKTRQDNGFPAIANANVQVIKADMTDAEMNALYGQADCMIWPGREGFGLPPREFAATGGTSIALNWGGTADDLPNWGLPIAVKGMETAWKGHEQLDGVGQWADPDVDDLAATMKHVAANRDFYRERGRQQAAFVRLKYQWSTFAEQVADVWKEACEAHGKRNLQTAV